MRPALEVADILLRASPTPEDVCKQSDY
jgi:hypothetical protein